MLFLIISYMSILCMYVCMYVWTCVWVCLQVHVNGFFYQKKGRKGSTYHQISASRQKKKRIKQCPRPHISLLIIILVMPLTLRSLQTCNWGGDQADVQRERVWERKRERGEDCWYWWQLFTRPRHEQKSGPVTTS